MRGIRRILLAGTGGADRRRRGLLVVRPSRHAPPKLTLKDDSSSATTQAAAPTSLGGTWKVVAGSGDDATSAGYRVKEKFAAGVAKVTAAGRTPDVTGTVTVVGKNVTTAKFSVNMTTLTSNKSQRDNQIRNRGSRRTSSPRDLHVDLTGPTPDFSRARSSSVRTGNLTLHGVTKKVTIPLKAKESGSTFFVQGSLPIVMADYPIQPPSIGGFVTVDGNGSLEFLASLAKS